MKSRDLGGYPAAGEARDGTYNGSRNLSFSSDGGEFVR